MDARSRPRSDFIDFPPRLRVLEILAGLDLYRPGLDGLFRELALRVGGKTYDRSAFAFILIELLYDAEARSRTDLSPLIPRVVVALTDDVHLAGSAYDSYCEIRETIHSGNTGLEVSVEEESIESADQASPGAGNESAGSGDDLGSIAEDDLAFGLARAQKAVTDLALPARIAIEIAIGHPRPQQVDAALTDIERLRTELHRFEKLLFEAELTIIRATGLRD